MIVRLLAVVITGLALIAPGAHVFELFRKMALSEQQYYVVQDIYRGWWVVGLLLPTALIANVALAIAVRDDLTERGARDRGGGTDPGQISSYLPSGPGRSISSPVTGRCTWPTGKRCAGNGNIPTPPMRELRWLLSVLRPWPHCAGRDLIFVAFGSRVLWQIVTQATLISARGCHR